MWESFILRKTGNQEKMRSRARAGTKSASQSNAGVLKEECICLAFFPSASPA